MIAEISKLRAETRKIMKDTVIAPMVAGAAFMGAAVALVGAVAAVLLKFYGVS